jgi:hypothetical protein
MPACPCSFGVFQPLAPIPRPRAPKGVNAAVWVQLAALVLVPVGCGGGGGTSSSGGSLAIVKVR